MNLNLCADIWRFYLIRIRPENDDANFTWLDFESKINGELIGNFGNLIHRVLILTYNNFKKIPTITNIELYEQLNLKYIEILNKYHDNMNKIKLKPILQKLNKFWQYYVIL